MAYGTILGQTPTASNVSYNNSSTSSIITGANVQQAIDQLFTSVSNGKQQIASAITDKGVSTSADDTFATMAENIGKISTGGGLGGYKSSNLQYSYNTPTVTDPDTWTNMPGFAFNQAGADKYIVLVLTNEGTVVMETRNTNLLYQMHGVNNQNIFLYFSMFQRSNGIYVPRFRAGNSYSAGANFNFTCYYFAYNFQSL